jgi:hypothetical protein
MYYMDAYRSVLFGVKRKRSHWQQVAARLDRWHVIDTTASEDEEEWQGLGLRAEAAGGGGAKAQDAAHA